LVCSGGTQEFLDGFTEAIEHTDLLFIYYYYAVTNWLAIASTTDPIYGSHECAAPMLSLSCRMRVHRPRYVAHEMGGEYLRAMSCLLSFLF
jgi:hypothetical protein